MFSASVKGTMFSGFQALFYSSESECQHGAQVIVGLFVYYIQISFPHTIMEGLQNLGADRTFYCHMNNVSNKQAVSII